MSKHSPGPWHRGTAFGQEFYVFDANGVAVVSAINKQDVPLIAAAPRMLATLKWIDALVREGADGDALDEISRRIRATIAETKGE